MPPLEDPAEPFCGADAAAENPTEFRRCSFLFMIIRVRQPRVQVKDDWDGFGQRMTATGTLLMRGPVLMLLETTGAIPGANLPRGDTEALMVGIGGQRFVMVWNTCERTRYSTLPAGYSRSDSQMLGIIGQLSAQLAAAELVRAIGREFDAGTRQATLTAQRPVWYPRSS